MVCRVGLTGPVFIALIALGFLGRARTSHLRALELEPANLSAMASLASIASHRGNHEEARSWAQKVLAVVPNFPDNQRPASTPPSNTPIALMVRRPVSAVLASPGGVP